VRRLFIAVLTVFCVFAAMPQILRAWTPNDLNATVAHFSGTDSDFGNSVAVDSSGNTFVTGDFRGTADFDPGVGTANLTSSGSQDVFVVKVNSSGEYVWAKQLGGCCFDSGYSVAVDSSGNTYVTGEFSGTADFDPGVGTANLTSAGGADVFVVKLNSSGGYVWANQFSGTGFGAGRSVAVDSSGNTFVTGFFEGTADFNPGVGTANLASSGSQDVFVVKLNSSGGYVWAKRFGGTDTDLGLSVAVDSSGNTFVAGYFLGEANFDPGSLSNANLTSSGSQDVFVVKLTTFGEYVWAKRFGGTSFDNGYSVAVDSSGNTFVAGFFSGTADFDPGVGTANLTSAGDADVFVVKLNSSGEYVWAKQLGGTGSDIGFSVAVDSSGNTYVAGDFASVYFGDCPGTACLRSAGDADAFVVKVNSSGGYVWAKRFGGTGSDIGFSVAVDSSGNTYVAGIFSGTADFDPSAGAANLTSSGYADVFVVKLNSVGESTPPTTVPVTTVPVTTVPATTVPATTVPATTVPATTVPATTVPATTVPVTTVPAKTAPVTTVPARTVPVTTVPATTVPAARQSTSVVTLPPKLGRVQQVLFKYTLKEPYQATIRWSKPKGAEDRFISYSVYREGQKRVGWLCRTYALSCLITNLYPDREYKFFVEATSSSGQTTSSVISKTLKTRLPKLEQEELKPPTGGRDVYGKSCNARLQDKSLNYWPIKSIPGFVRLQSDCSGRVLFMSKTPVEILQQFERKSPLGNFDFYIPDDALELSLSSAVEDDRLVSNALSYIFKQSDLRRWAITESISSSYPSGCVAQRNDFVFEKNQAWNWFRNTPGWSRNCEVRLRKETTGVQTKTIRLRWTYPTACLPGKNCDVNKNQFNEFQLSYLRLVIVVEN
jgi:hypothetical protein